MVRRGGGVSRTIRRWWRKQAHDDAGVVVEQAARLWLDNDEDKASRMKVEGQKDTGDDRHDRQRTSRLQQEECKQRGWGLGEHIWPRRDEPITFTLILSFFRSAFVFCICRCTWLCLVYVAVNCKDIFRLTFIWNSSKVVERTRFWNVKYTLVFMILIKTIDLGFHLRLLENIYH